MNLQHRDCLAAEVQVVEIGAKMPVSTGVKSGHYAYFLRRGSFRITSQSGTATASAGQILWIGAGVPRCLHTNGAAEWIVLRIRNHLFAPGNPADRVAWQTLMRLARLSTRHPRLVLSPAGQSRLFALVEAYTRSDISGEDAALVMRKGLVLQLLAGVQTDPVFLEAVAGLPDPQPQLDLLQGVLILLDEEAPGIADAAALARRAGLSRSSLYRLFASAGLPAPRVLLERARLERAVRLLQESDQTILSIAMETGFGSLSAFYRVFTRAYGESPGAFRSSKE